MFLSKYFFQIIKNSKRLSVSSAGACLLVLLLALIGPKLSFLLPYGWGEFLDKDALHEILRILASSMLLVVTFSLSTMVSAYVAASEGVTPRAAKLLMEDQSSQRTLSVFLSAFVFSMFTLGALSANYYKDREILILFIFTLGIIFLVVWTIIGWIERLSKLGRVHETIRTVEESTRQAMTSRLDSVESLYRHYSELPENLQTIDLKDIGYLQSIGYESLKTVCDQNQIIVYVCVQAGTFVTGQTVVAHVDGLGERKLTDKIKNDIRGCFATGSSRYFENDPRFGLITLSEVASRALSPAINDPGTAIDVIGSMIRLFCHWDQKLSNVPGPSAGICRLRVSTLEVEDFFEDIVHSLSRDGAKHIEVMIRLYKAIDGFKALKKPEFQTNSEKYKDIILSRAHASLPDTTDKDMFNAVVAGLESSGS